MIKLLSYIKKVGCGMKIGDILIKIIKKYDIHGSILYPAVMVAPIQKEILQQIIRDENIECVFDPFHGSGTALYEALEISDEIKLIGCDINPLANLITKVKLQGVNKNIDLDIQNLKQNLQKEIDYDKHNFKNMDKWFRKDVIESLCLVRHCIMKISDEKIDCIFGICYVILLENIVIREVQPINCI